MKRLMLIVVLMYSSSSFAAEFTGYVEEIAIHSDSWGTYNENDAAMLSIYMEGMPLGCGMSNGTNRVAIRTSHPLFNATLSLVIAAKMAGKQLQVTYLNTCNTRSGVWDFGYISLKE